MAINRLIVGIFALSFNLWAARRGLMSGPLLVIAPGLYILLGAVLALHLARRPAPATPRRLLALLLDCAGASTELHIGGAATVWQFAGYLWIIFGNGFRFGSRFQAYAMFAATTGFIITAATTPYWRGQPAQLFGGLISLTVVPLYALGLINRLSQARQQAEEASRAKSLFLASVSHELRTPLNAVIGMGALLESSALQPEQLQMSRTIMAAGRSLLTLIDGILDLSRTEAGRGSVDNTDFNLADLLSEISTVFAAQERLKAVPLHLHVTARTPLALHGDARKLHEILLNLTGNAMKFTDSGSVTLAVDATARQGSQATLRFEVTDTGIGIAPEAHERIFEAFTQADESIVNRFGGTGLGLTLVRNAVHLLGGSIGVRSAPGAGSTFWLELPLHTQPAAAQTQPLPPLHALVQTRQAAQIAPLLGRLTACGVSIEHIAVSPPGWPSGGPASIALLAFAHTGGGHSFIDIRHGLSEGLPDAGTRLRYTSRLLLPVADAELATVLQLAGRAEGSTLATPQALPLAPQPFHLLVADDNATNRHVTEKILRAAGHEVTLVNNGEQALDQLATQTFDIAVLDVNMPVMDGIEVAKIYRMTEASPIPLLALTADATPGTRERCLAAGMAACLVKPIEPARLLTVIDQTIHSARGTEPVPPKPRVTEIATHPRFRASAATTAAATSTAINHEVLARLITLGGPAFLAEVCELFRGEARDTMQELRAAAAQGDVPRFRTHAHALRSVAANVGAGVLYDMCLPYQSTSAAELRQNAPAWLEQLGAELARADRALAEYCASRNAQSG